MYILDISRKQASILIEALDLYSRIGMGQFDEIVSVHSKSKPEIIVSPNKEQEYFLRGLKHSLAGLDDNSYHSIHSGDISDDFRVAFDIQQVVRNRLWKDAGGDDHHRYSVCSSVYSCSEEKLSTIKKTEIPPNES